MDAWELDRRQLLSSGAGLLGASVGLGSVGTTEAQSSDSNSSDSSDGPANTEATYVGLPLEHAWTLDHEQLDANFGGIAGRTTYASFTAGESGSAEIVAIDTATGEQETIFERETLPYSPVLRGDLLYAIGDTSVYAIDPDDGTVVWEHGTHKDGFLPLRVTDSTVYATSYRFSQEFVEGEYASTTHDAELVALDRKSGDRKWSTASKRMLWWPEGLGDTLLIKENVPTFDDGLTEYDGRVLALDRETGNLRWATDRTNPRSITPAGKKRAVVSANDGRLSVLTQDGDRRLLADVGRRNYFVMDGAVYSALDGPGIRAFDVETGDELDLPNVGKQVTAIRGWGSTLYVGVQGELLALDLDRSRVEWRSSVSGRPAVISGLDDAGFVEFDGNDVSVFDTRSGDVHHTYRFEAESLRPQFADGVLYVAGDDCPLSAYVGRRRRAEFAVATEAERSGVATVLADAFGRSGTVEKARTAVEAGNFDRAERLAGRARRQRQLAQASVAVTTAGTTYGVGRLGSKWKQERELADAVRAVEGSYPVATGAFEGCNPDELLQQARVARESLEKTRTGTPVQNVVVENEHSELIATLDGMAERRVPIRGASNRAEELDSQALPTEWKQSLRSAIDTGDLERIDRTVERIKLASKSLDKLSTLRTALGETPLAGEADDFGEVVETALASSVDGTSASQTDDGNTHLSSLNRFMSAYADAASAFADHRRTLGEFDLEPLRSVLERLLSDLVAGAVENDEVPDEAGFADRTATVESIADAFEAATTAVEHLDEIQFDHADRSRSEYVTRIQRAIDDRNVGRLRELAETIENVAQGRWKRQHLFAFSPTEFEYVVASLYDDAGYRVTVTDASRDRGVDVVAESTDEVLAVQVKQYDVSNDIGRPEVQQMIGAMAQAGADRAVVVTTSGFASTAEETARELGGVVELIDGRELLRRLTESGVAPPTLGGGRSSDQSEQYRERTERGSGNASDGSTGRSSSATGEMSRREAFGVLGIETEADEETVTAAYRERVKETHPDTGSGDSEEFQRVMTAYSTLSNEQ